MRSKKTILNVGTNLMYQFVLLLYGFIAPKIIISNYGSDVNGLVSSITKFLSYIVLIEAGFAPVVRFALFKPIANNDKETILKILAASEKFFKKIAYIFLAYITVLIFTYPFLVNNQFDFLFTASLIVIIAFATFAEYYFGITYASYLYSNQKTYISSIIQLVSYILCITTILLLARTNCSIHVFKLASCFFFALRPIVQNIYVKKKYKISLKNVDSNYDIKQKWDALSSHVAYVIHTNTDVALLTIFRTLKDVSVYSVYYLVVFGVKNLISAFTSGVDATFGDMIARGEHDNLNKKYNMYEVCYLTIVTIIFVSTMLLITPFISVYTKGVTDANYIRYTFGYLLVISEFIWAVRNPYQSLTKNAGHFKETKNGAWVEAIVNIIVSVILVIKFGIIGVAIGTIVAMTIRMIEFIYHSNKHILKRSQLISVKKILIIVAETLIICFVSKYLPYFDNTNYFYWALNGCMVFVLSTFIIFAINVILFKKDFKMLLEILKTLLKRNKIAKEDK